ncbi:MAG: class I tRNA ligase family protein [bacterium]
MSREPRRVDAAKTHDPARIDEVSRVPRRSDQGASYDPRRIEAGWQERWEALDLFRAARAPGRPKYYGYNPAPYLTGSLHMGHVRNYAYGDFLARVMRLQGANVLFTIGFDAFGLPTEMAAIRNRCSPAEWTARCRAAMETQLRALGFGFDWRRSFLTSDVSYYRWTQWIFLQLLERGLIFSTEAVTDWCPSCETSLAHSQVVGGRCWLCDGPVEKRSTREWRLRITPYLGELRAGLEEIHDLNGLANEGQRILIGEEIGAAVELELRPGGARFAAFLRDSRDWEKDCVLAVDARDAKTQAMVGGANGDATVVEVSTGRELRVEIVSSRDPLFADQPFLATRSDPGGRAVPPPRSEPGGGRVPPLRSDPGGGSAPRRPAPATVPMTVYRQKDFSISRQRFWGTPIPVVLCAACGEVPLSVDDLPLVAPDVVFDEASGKLRHADASWGDRACPSCGKPARLDPLVMDCHMDSLWHYFRPCAAVDPAAADFLFDPAEVAYWMPVDSIQFGRDVIPFMLDLRFFTRFLHDLGRVPFREFCRETLAHGLVLHDGRKMSKHLGNVVLPKDVVARYGADSVRFYILAHGDPRSDFDWSEDGIRRYFALLSSFHEMIAAYAATPWPGEASPGPPPSPEAGPPARPALTKYARILLEKVAKQVDLLDRSVADRSIDRYANALRHLLAALIFFRTNHAARERDPMFQRRWREIVRDAVVHLAPVAPHLAEECWRMLGESGSLFQQARFPGAHAQGPEVAERHPSPRRHEDVS